jgi:hypothetical protein
MPFHWNAAFNAGMNAADCSCPFTMSSAVQRFENIQVFFAGNCENSFDSFVLQRCN